MSLIDESDLEWYEGASFRGHVGTPDADRIVKLCAVYRAAAVYLRELDARRDGDASGRELLDAEIALRDAVHRGLPNDRIERALRMVGSHHQPDEDWSQAVLERVQLEETRSVRVGFLARAWRRVRLFLTRW